ncbi:hypothetical protein [Streptomyces luteireticuli]|uniref:DUF4034 domain-containing protein n=1 Tax=Streptomyces luteireticuli TaxID=173858 RepID=A0ABN0Z727_9ACTN
MVAGSFEGRYVWHPAADDHELAQACVDVQAGRYQSAHAVLHDVRTDFATRAHRSLVLASMAADSDLAERGLAEAPGPDAALLWARVAMLRALRMAGTEDRRTASLIRIAEAACDQAARMAPEDPTPWVARLALARTGPVHDQDPAPRGMLTAPRGPWALFSRALALDPWNREAHHRFLSFYFARHGGSASARWDVAEFLGNRAPAHSPLRLLPLVTLVEDFDPKADPFAIRAWRQRRWRTLALDVYAHWFPDVPGYRFTPVLDLAYLAHALYLADCQAEACKVFTAMGPYASRMPWSAFGAPEDQLSRARRRCGLPVPP